MILKTLATRKSWIVSGLSAITLASSLLVAPPSQAADYCQCVEYVKRTFGITSAVGNAKDMIYSLPNLGFNRISSPQPGAVMVMQPSYRGAHPTYGHVGIIERVDNRNGNTYITLRAANQSGNQFTERNCNDVTVIGFATPVNGRSDVSYWVRGIQPPSVRVVNFSGKAGPYAVNIRSAPSLNASIVGRLQPNQSVSFNAWTYGDQVNDIWAGTPDKRWFRLKINGQDAWVASGVIWGNPPNSSPMP
jgi:surface antigen